MTTAPGYKVGKKKSLAPMFAEKLISPHRKGATWAKLPKDRSAKLGDHEKRNENREEDEVKTRELGPDEEGKKSSSGDVPGWWLKDIKGQS